MDDLTDALGRQRQEEQRRALRALLARPLLRAEDAAFALVRRHAPGLRDWLTRETGWYLQTERDFVRLHKRPADHADATRPARVGKGTQRKTFNRRRYALFCLLLADLERGEAQITLGRLGEGLGQAVAEPALAERGLAFSLDNQEARRDLVVVVRLLLELGVLVRVAGDEEAFLRRGVDGDVLYDVDRRVLSALLVTSRGPSLVALGGADGTLDLEARLKALAESFVPDTPEGRNRALRHRLARRLLDDPVIYWEALDEDEAAYLTNQRGAMARRLQQATGLVPEVRAEGLAMVDPEGELTDERVPAEGTEGHLALLMAERLAEIGPEGATLAEAEAWIGAWQTQYRRYWRKAACEPGAAGGLCRQALARLASLRLVERRDQRVYPLPALGRFRVQAAALPDDEAPRQPDLANGETP
ncbi:TIGR02678 family protein [Halomonas sp. 328]|uniref:TIGR02678 family protein n=1 Tax=Halomonas sp. 328 TaxID=2776704 RepID=UPI0018A73B3F|nr:TIGR02678 family protein [Halomonas sp. 328]MBF8221523.1 TIGR02678 family protein [Halomonas sp. 328]